MSDEPKRISLPMTGPAGDLPSEGATVEQPSEDRPVAGSVSLSAEQVEEIRENAIAALRTCFDPELPASIVDLGLVYRLDVQSSGQVEVDMTLTSPACPVASSLVGEVQRKLASIPGATAARVNLVWDPPWTQDRMSEATRLELGLFG